MLRELRIKNYKSIRDIKVELGAVNIFIGENGCGKTNILEALAMAGASKGLDLNVEGLYNRGVRVAKPNLTFSSFAGLRQNKKITIDLAFRRENEEFIIPSILYCEDDNDIYSKWKDENRIYLLTVDEPELHMRKLPPDAEDKGKNRPTADIPAWDGARKTKWLAEDLHRLTSYLIFHLNTISLRGVRSESKKMPLGVNGENLDILLSQFSDREWDRLKKYRYLINWLDEIIIDEKDALKFNGHKLGRSASTLYFKDKFMQKKDGNNVFSAENANDGVLYILFYLALFISQKTPSFFAIDNIEASLNPRICRTLVKELSRLSKTNNKQALITTHNPAVLDGLNLNDEEQRLFVVFRSDEGKTRIKRIKMKPKSDESLKLSEMWTRGVLGGLPKNF